MKSTHQDQQGTKTRKRSSIRHTHETPVEVVKPKKDAYISDGYEDEEDVNMEDVYVTYEDKHGREILAGMTIRHDNGDIEKVVETVGAYGNYDLGVSAVKPEYAEENLMYPPECYSLSNFDMSEWEIVGES